MVSYACCSLFLSGHQRKQFSAYLFRNYESVEDMRKEKAVAVWSWCAHIEYQSVVICCRLPTISTLSSRPCSHVNVSIHRHIDFCNIKAFHPLLLFSNDSPEFCVAPSVKYCPRAHIGHTFPNFPKCRVPYWRVSARPVPPARGISSAPNDNAGTCSNRRKCRLLASKVMRCFHDSVTGVNWWMKTFGTKCPYVPLCPSMSFSLNNLEWYCLIRSNEWSEYL